MVDSRAFIILMITLLSGWRPVEAQTIPGALSDQARLSILIVGPADPLYTMFGHTAIRLHDTVRQIDVVYNYGTFDFESTGFYWKFALDNLHYFLSKSSFEAYKKENRLLGRSIQEQILNLSFVQIRNVIRHLETELFPEKRYYRYKFFDNNCVTKVRDLLMQQELLTPPSPAW